MTSPSAAGRSINENPGMRDHYPAVHDRIGHGAFDRDVGIRRSVGGDLVIQRVEEREVEVTLGVNVEWTLAFEIDRAAEGEVRVLRLPVSDASW